VIPGYQFLYRLLPYWWSELRITSCALRPRVDHQASPCDFQVRLGFLWYWLLPAHPIVILHSLQFFASVCFLFGLYSYLAGRTGDISIILMNVSWLSRISYWYSKRIWTCSSYLHYTPPTKLFANLNRVVVETSYLVSVCSDIYLYSLSGYLLPVAWVSCVNLYSTQSPIQIPETVC
jgi:hypothetical protein